MKTSDQIESMEQQGKPDTINASRGRAFTSLTIERDKYKASAERLAEALKLLMNAYITIPDNQIGCNIAHRYDKARAALAEWEAQK